MLPKPPKDERLDVDLLLLVRAAPNATLVVAARGDEDDEPPPQLQVPRLRV